jgi:hypothetical protein
MLDSPFYAFIMVSKSPGPHVHVLVDLPLHGAMAHTVNAVFKSKKLISKIAKASDPESE